MSRQITIAKSFKRSNRLAKFYQKSVVEEKLNNWLGYVLVSGIAAISAILSSVNPLFGIGLIGLLAGIVIIAICLLNTEAGLLINMAYSFFAFHFSRLFFKDTFPVGPVSDLLIVVTFLGLFFRGINWRQTINDFTKSGIGLCILIYTAYLFIELFNPNSRSFEAWLLAFRKISTSVLLLFISYVIFTEYKNIRKFIKWTFILCTIAGIYGCIQQWHGLFQFERDFAFASEKRFTLTYIGEYFRKFSTFSDSSAFGVVMAAGSVMAIILSTGQSKKNRSILLAGSLFMILGMVYSQTRTANAMLVAGIFMFCLLTIDKKNTKILSVISVLALLFILYAPVYSFPMLNRFRTTFSGTKDESYKVRVLNRAFVQPYIYSHPIGGGLGTTEGSGLRYHPGHYLAGFPTDSGYLKKALETGWIGLILMCTLYFIVMKTAIAGYFRVRSPEAKLIYAAAASVMFSFYVGEYPQSSIGQITDIVIYYPMLGVILRLHEVENRRRLKTKPISSEA